jgi:hypothetical protein
MASLIGKGKSCSSNDNMQQRSSACSSAPESDEDTSHNLPPVQGYIYAHTPVLKLPTVEPLFYYYYSFSVSLGDLFSFLATLLHYNMHRGSLEWEGCSALLMII